MKKIYLTITLILSLASGYAQQALTLYNMYGVAQTAQVNPSFIPEEKFYIGIPALSSTTFMFTNSGFTWRDLHYVRTDDSVAIQVDNAINKLADKNFIALSIRESLFEGGFRYKKNYFTFNVTEKANLNFTFPKQLFELILKGNGQFVGQEINLRRTTFDITHHREYAIGFARTINNKVTVGGKLKYLYGMENFSTGKSTLHFYTSPDDYQLQLSSDYVIHTSTTGNDTSGSSGSYMFGLKNTGFATDLGVTYKYNDRWKFMASFIDIGYIKWKSNVKNFVAVQGDYKFNGFDIDQFMSDDSSGGSNIADSIQNTFKPTENSDAYKTNLPTHIYLNSVFQVNSNSNLSGLLHAEIFRQTVQPTITVSYNRKITNNFAGCINYSMINHHMNNVGIGLSAVFGKVQFYMISDNIVGTINPLSGHTTHLSFGFNLVFGRPVVKKGVTDFGVQDKSLPVIDAGLDQDKKE